MSWEYEGASKIERLRKEIERKNDIEFARILADYSQKMGAAAYTEKFLDTYKKLRGGYKYEKDSDLTGGVESL
jgi:hypothetical protein